MKTLYRPLLISAIFILGIPLTAALADNANNPWSPSYHPQTNTYQGRPTPHYAPNYTRHGYSARPDTYYRSQQVRPPAMTTRRAPPAQRPPVMNPYYPNSAAAYQGNNRNNPYYRPLPPPHWQPYTGPAAGYGNRNPAYQPYNNQRFNHNNVWGRSGPNTWTHPNKHNFRNGWDDMLNAPSRMGEMPGGWNAPSVSMPNPVDVGDQFQQNARNLPDQMRTMNGR